MPEIEITVVVDPAADVTVVAQEIAKLDGIIEIRMTERVAATSAPLRAATLIAHAAGAAPTYGMLGAPYGPLDVKQSPAHLERAYRMACEAAAGEPELLNALAAARDTVLDGQA